MGADSRVRAFDDSAFDTLLPAPEPGAQPVAPAPQPWDGSRRWIDLIPDGVLVVDREGIVRCANEAMRELSGRTPAQLEGAALSWLLPPALRERHGAHLQAYFAAPHSRAMGRVSELHLWHAEGRVRPVDISLGLCRFEQRTCTLAVIRDVSQFQALHEQLRRQAVHDGLTGLYSRYMFGELLGRALEHSGRSGLPAALLLIDLDDFKSVNDGHGHHVGDALLKEVARRMRRCLRLSDVLARLGGDEFAVLLPELADPDDATRVAEKLVRALVQPWRQQHHELSPGASIGIVLLPRDGRDADTLMRRADMAMYRAKEAGRGGYAVYDAEMSRRMEDKLRLQARLKQALQAADGGGLSLHYQPQVAARSGQVVALEALLRWQDAELGEVSPARFVPVAESTGLILPLGDWVLARACAQLAEWQARGLGLRVSVNVSPHQLRQPGFAQRLAELLQQHAVPPELLELEITESAAMTHREQASALLEQIVGLGVQLALDDFGMGYSSLGHLQQLPVSRLKIDRSFIRGVPEREADAVLTRAVIGLARTLGKGLVAEGVETLAQHAFLAGEGCELLQGWLFAPALPPAELLDWLGRERAGACARPAGTPPVSPCPPPAPGLSPSCPVP